MKKIAVLILVIFCIFSCKNDTKNKKDDLVFGIIMSVDNQSKIEQYDKVCEYLSKEIGQKVTYVKGSDYATVIEAMKTGKVDFALTGPFSYLIANSKAGAESLVATAYSDGHINNYSSIIFTSADSGITSIDQIKANPEKYSIAFSDPASTSGYLYPLSYLRSIGIEPNEDMKQALFAGGHTAGIFSCLSQKVDIACTTANSLERLLRKERIQEGSYIVLWQSEAIPPSNIYVHKDMPQETKHKLRDAYVGMKDKNPALMQLIKDQYNKDIHYIPVHDSIYNDMRKLINKELGSLLK